MDAAISHLPTALWTRGFPVFLAELIATLRVEPEVSYFAPVEAENSLARFLFSPLSKHRDRLDSLCQGMVRDRSEDFIRKLVECCNALIPNRHLLSLPEQSLCLLLMYRALFNRCYELHHSFFFRLGGEFELIKRVKSMGAVQANCFSVPWDLVPKMPPTTAIARLFEADPHYRAGADHLFTAIFVPNPIDQLYEIHNALMMIHKGAMVARKGPEPVGKPELLSFDDLFALFFGVLTASSLPDLFFLHRMVDDYAPKSWLSPPFEYAQANLEALVLHCTQFKPELLKLAEEEPPP
jgi:hypothetical protein